MALCFSSKKWLTELNGRADWFHMNPLDNMSTLAEIFHNPAEKDFHASRFWRYVNVRDSNDLCWEWTRSINRGGYGLYRFGNKTVSTHRIAFALHHGRPIKEGKILMHSCDNPRCCNPHHLCEGTHVENSQDAASKGRSANQLTESEKTFIRENFPTLSGVEIARRLGRGKSTINCWIQKARLSGNRLRRKPLTESEKDFIRKNFPAISGAEIGRRIGRDRAVINEWIQKNGLGDTRLINKPLTESEKTFIAENFPTLSGAEIGKRIGRDRSVINTWIRKEGLRSHILQN